MFVVSYYDFVRRSFYNGFSVTYMPGLIVEHVDSVKVLVNVDSRSAFVYSD